MSAGERDLETLIAGMAPVLDTLSYQFVSVPRGGHPQADTLMRFQEAEGDTLILPDAIAKDLGLSTERIYARITLTVHSDLEAIGLTAAFAACLKEAMIPANVVAGYFHDHIFVPAALADRAMTALKAFSSRRQA